MSRIGDFLKIENLLKKAIHKESNILHWGVMLKKSGQHYYTMWGLQITEVSKGYKIDTILHQWP